MEEPVLPQNIIMKRTTEERYPIIASVILTGIFIVVKQFFSICPVLNESILSTSITVASIFIGFNAVYRNTLQTKVGKAIQAVKNTSYMELYHGYLKAVTNSALRFILVSFIILFLPDKQLNHCVTFYIWFFFASNMLLCFHRANSIDSILFES